MLTANLSLVVFSLSGHRFALPAEAVQEVVRAVAIDRLPGAPAIVEGVVNRRGTIVPVLDIRARFELPALPLSIDQHFVVAMAGSREVVLRVDRATDLIELPVEDLVSADVPGARYVAGIARLSDGLVVIHDLASFLSHDESLTLDEALG